MKFNAKKCYILSTGNTSSHFYQLDKTFLQQVTSNPYLGVQLDKNLSWHEHISGVVKRANASLGQIRRNLRFCPQECRKTAYMGPSFIDDTTIFLMENTDVEKYK